MSLSRFLSCSRRGLAFGAVLASVLGASNSAFGYDDDYVTIPDDDSVRTNWVGDRVVYIFTNTASAVTLTLNQNMTLQEALLVGGGGAGAALKGGGGGGGGVIDHTVPQLLASGTEFAIHIGKGGVGTTTRSTANKGEETTVSFMRNEWVAFGGGGGGSDGASNWKPSQGGNVGSGGGTGAGGSITHTDGDDYTAAQGKPGGNSNGGVGGGGGFSESGENGVPGKSGRGGEGLTNSITGVSKVYGSGGGGGAGNPNTGTVGAGGEGKGGTNAGDGAPYVAGAAGCDAPAGFGGGGGGGGYVNPTTTRGGNGGSGVVILAFTVGGKAGQPAVREEDIVIGHDGDTTLPSISVTMSSTEPDMTYSAQVRISCGTGELARAGIAYECVRDDFASVTNGQVLAFLANFYPATGEQVYVKVEVTAVGAEDVSASNDKPAEGTVPAFVGHGGGAHIIHVRPGAKGKADGTSWADAYTDFREAVKLLDAGRPELWFCGSNTADINTKTISPSVAAVIRGGFTGLEDSVSERPAGSRSVIDSADEIDCLTINNTQPVTLEGFFVTKGYQHGLLKSGAGDITVTNCVFDGNGTYAGGAVSGRAIELSGTASSTTATVADCTILRHYERAVAGAAGALSLSSLKQAWVTGCLFASNGLAFGTTPFGAHVGRSGCWGSALAVDATPVTVERCEFRANVALSGNVLGTDVGGLVNLRGNCGESVFRNCAWVGNEVLYTRVSKESEDSNQDFEGGVLVVDVTDDSTVAVENCTFAGNLYEGHYSTAGLNVRTGTVNLKDSIFFANFSGNTCGDISPADLRVQAGATAHVTYTMFGGETNRLADTGGTLDIGVGCVDDDPLFATTAEVYASCRTLTGGHYYYTAESAPTLLAADIHESANSPAIDTGDPKSPYKNELKPNGRRVNLGRYGNTPEAMTTKTGLTLIIR